MEFKEKKSSTSLAFEDFEMFITMFTHFKGLLYLHRNDNDLPFDVFEDYICSDICIRKIDDFLKGE